MLDEWAVDQDTACRSCFYEEILPALKQEGRTIIMATNDYQYFNMADALYEFDSGKVINRTPNSSQNK